MESTFRDPSPRADHSGQERASWRFQDSSDARVQAVGDLGSARHSQGTWTLCFTGPQDQSQQPLYRCVSTPAGVRVS